MNTKVAKLVEEFNNKYPDGNAVALAKYLLENTEVKDNPDNTFPAHDIDRIETIDVVLSKDKFPMARLAKLEELMNSKAFDTLAEAEAWLDETPISLEVYYEKHEGLFAVESDALDNCPVGWIVSPYSKKLVVIPGD
jgi:hypothetical protein